MEKIMRILKYKILLLLILTILYDKSVSGQLSSDSLMYYLEISAKNNPGVLQKFSEYKAALQKIPQVGSLPDPELSMGVFLKPMELMSGYQVSDLRLMQMFPWFGVLKNARDEMSLMARAKYESFTESKLNLFFDVQRTWFEMAKLKQEILFSESNVEILKTIERLALVRYKSPVSKGDVSSSGGINPTGTTTVITASQGMQQMGGSQQNNSGSISNQGSSSMSGPVMGSETGSSGLADLYRIQIEIGDLQNNIASLKNLMVTITSRFNTYLNRPVGATVTLPDSLQPEKFDIATPAIEDSILGRNPMLGMLRYEEQSLDARYRMVTDMGYPMIGLGINYTIISKLPYAGIAMNGKDMLMPMVTVTLPIYRKKYKAMKSEVELLKTASIQGYSATLNSLKTEYYEALQLYNDALRRQTLYDEQYQLADKSLNIMLKSFSSSGAGLTDILRIRQQTIDYKIKQVEAVADYNTAVAWLKRLMAYYQINQI
jgi:outer membrane protein TolC